MALDKNKILPILTFEDELIKLKVDNNIDKLRKNVQHIQTVGSKMAQFYILNTKLNDNSLKIRDIAEIWFKEIEGPLNKIASQARKRFTNKLDRSNYFIIHVLFYLLTGEISSKEITEADINEITENMTCPFLRNSWNYISILMNTGKCLCMCYASYIRAAAEEYHLNNYVKMCEGERSYSIVVTDKDKPITHIGVGFKRNTYNISITSDKDLTHIISDIPAISSRVVKNKIKEKCFSWNDITIIMNRITDKRDSTNMIAELLYVGIIYEIEDFIDNILYLYLVNKELDKYHTMWNSGNLSWNDYHKVEKN